MALTTLNLTLAKDCSIFEEQPTTNQNGLFLWIRGGGGGAMRTLLHFNGASAVPDGAVVTAFQLTGYCAVGAANPHAFSMLPITNTVWSRAAVTWNTRDGTNAWVTPGLGASDYAAAGAQGGFLTPTSTGLKNYSGTAAAQWLISNGQKAEFHLLLKQDDETGAYEDARFYDEENSTAPNPKFVASLTYRDPAATVSALSINASGQLIFIATLPSQSWVNADSNDPTNYEITLTRNGEAVNLVGTAVGLVPVAGSLAVTVTLDGPIYATDTAVTVTASDGDVSDDDGHTVAAIVAGAATNNSSLSEPSTSSTRRRNWRSLVRRLRG